MFGRYIVSDFNSLVQLFSLDSGFYNRKLCHSRYCIVFIDVGQYEATAFIRRLLRHSEFETRAKRLGTVIRVSPTGLLVWRLNAEKATQIDWEV